MEERHDLDLRLISRLKEYGLQITYQRLAIYKALWDTKEHPSAEAIYQQVRKRFPMISLGTVYKTLEKFYERGLIQRVSPVTEVARYDADTGSHCHLICDKCQSIRDFQSTVPFQPGFLPEGSGFEVRSSQLILHGYCHNCIPVDRVEKQAFGRE